MHDAIIFYAVIISPRLIHHTTRTRPAATPSSHQSHVRMSSLRRVLCIDPEARTADVEAGATYSTLCRATLSHEAGPFLPAVVPSVGSVTVGGAVAGATVSSSSFHCGCVHDSVLVWIVLYCVMAPCYSLFVGVLFCSRSRTSTQAEQSTGTVSYSATPNAAAQGQKRYSTQNIQ